MDFTLSPEIEDIRVRTRAFVEEHVLPLEADPANYDEHENIRLDVLRAVQAKARAEGLWAPQAPKESAGWLCRSSAGRRCTRRPTARSSARSRSTARRPTTAT